MKMKVSDIKSLASRLGYGIKKTLKQDIINEFLSFQEGENDGDSL